MVSQGAGMGLEQGDGGMRGAPLIENSRSVATIQHALLPCKQGAADLVASRIPPGLGLWSNRSYGIVRIFDLSDFRISELLYLRIFDFCDFRFL